MKNVWQMPMLSPYLQRSLVLDSGHLLVQVPKRSGLLWKRIAQKEFGIISRTRCCWNSQRADALIFRATTPLFRCKLKSKGHGKLSIHFIAEYPQLRLFGIIVSAKPISSVSREQLQTCVKNLKPIKIDRATWCIDGSINCSRWNQGRSSFGEWHPITPESSIAAIWRTNEIAFTRK